ncbi:MAG: sodium:calcium antiporter [Phototrophicaceae bacterium]
MNLTAILIGIILLYVGGIALVASISKLGQIYRIPEFIVGFTFITLVTASPEIMVALQAGLNNAGQLVMGTVIGSNILNIGLVLGLTSVIYGGFPISSVLVRRGIPLMVALCFLSFGILFIFGMNRWVAVIFIIGYLIFNLVMLQLIRQDNHLQQQMTQEMRPISLEGIITTDKLLADDPKLTKSKVAPPKTWLEVVRLIVGIITLVIGARLIVLEALKMAETLGANYSIIGVTFVAFAVVLPEIITIFALDSKENSDLYFGNLMGSSVANILLVVGITGLIHPFEVDRHLLYFEYPAMLFLMVLMIPIGFDRRFSRFEGMMNVGLVVLFFVGVFTL